MALFAFPLRSTLRPALKLKLGILSSLLLLSIGLRLRYLDEVTILGICFLSGRRPATRFLCWRHLTRRPLAPWIERQWRSVLQVAPPDLIVTSGVGARQASSVSFMDSLIQRGYRLIRRLEDLTIYQLIEAAQGPQRRRSCCGSAGGGG